MWRMGAGNIGREFHFNDAGFLDYPTPVDFLFNYIPGERSHKLKSGLGSLSTSGYSKSAKSITFFSHPTVGHEGKRETCSIAWTSRFDGLILEDFTGEVGGLKFKLDKGVHWNPRQGQWEYDPKKFRKEAVAKDVANVLQKTARIIRKRIIEILRQIENDPAWNWAAMTPERQERKDAPNTITNALEGLRTGFGSLKAFPYLAKRTIEIVPSEKQQLKDYDDPDNYYAEYALPLRKEVAAAVKKAVSSGLYREITFSVNDYGAVRVVYPP